MGLKVDVCIRTLSVHIRTLATINMTTDFNLYRQNILSMFVTV